VLSHTPADRTSKQQATDKYSKNKDHLPETAAAITSSTKQCNQQCTIFLYAFQLEITINQINFISGQHE